MLSHRLASCQLIQANFQTPCSSSSAANSGRLTKRLKQTLCFSGVDRGAHVSLRFALVAMPRSLPE